MTQSTLNNIKMYLCTNLVYWVLDKGVKYLIFSVKSKKISCTYYVWYSVYVKANKGYEIKNAGVLEDLYLV